MSELVMFVKESYDGNAKVTNFTADVLKMFGVSYVLIGWIHQDGEYRTTLCHRVLLSLYPFQEPAL